MTALAPTQPTTDAADLAAAVEHMMAGWKAADTAKRKEYRQSLAQARDWWNSLEPAAQADPGNARKNLIRSAVEVAVARLDAAERAAEAAEAEQQRVWEEKCQRALRAKERRQRVEAWIIDNADVKFRVPVDPALLPKANPEAVRFIMRDGVPLEVADADAEAWKDDHEAGTDYARNWFIFGPSGCGKTRLAWHLVMKHVRMTEDPESVVFWTFHQWTKVYQFAQQSSEELSEYTAVIASAELVVIDEFEPGMSEPQARGFPELLKSRFDRCLRLIVTSMFSLDDCLARWRDNPNLERWGSAIRRRLVDDQCMTPVCLDKEPK